MTQQTKTPRNPPQSRPQDMLQQPMDRKKFLKVTGLAALSVIGLGQVIKLLQPASPAPKGPARKSPSYGVSVYGGTARRNA